MQIAVKAFEIYSESCLTFQLVKLLTISQLRKTLIHIIGNTQLSAILTH